MESDGKWDGVVQQKIDGEITNSMISGNGNKTISIKGDILQVRVGRRIEFFTPTTTTYVTLRVKTGLGIIVFEKTGEGPIHYSTAIQTVAE